MNALGMMYLCLWVNVCNIKATSCLSQLSYVHQLTLWFFFGHPRSPPQWYYLHLAPRPAPYSTSWEARKNQKLSFVRLLLDDQTSLVPVSLEADIYNPSQRACPRCRLPPKDPWEANSRSQVTCSTDLHAQSSCQLLIRLCPRTRLQILWHSLYLFF